MQNAKKDTITKKPRHYLFWRMTRSKPRTELGLPPPFFDRRPDSDRLQQRRRRSGVANTPPASARGLPTAPTRTDKDIKYKSLSRPWHWTLPGKKTRNWSWAASGVRKKLRRKTMPQYGQHWTTTRSNATTIKISQIELDGRSLPESGRAPTLNRDHRCRSSAK